MRSASIAIWKFVINEMKFTYPFRKKSTKIYKSQFSIRFVDTREWQRFRSKWMATQIYCSNGNQSHGKIISHMICLLDSAHIAPIQFAGRSPKPGVLTSYRNGTHLFSLNLITGAGTSSAVILRFSCRPLNANTHKHTLAVAIHGSRLACSLWWR